jgi:hypothetical protein
VHTDASDDHDDDNRGDCTERGESEPHCLGGHRDAQETVAGHRHLLERSGMRFRHEDLRGTEDKNGNEEENEHP